jgi:hypothetical protein
MKNKETKVKSILSIVISTIVFIFVGIMIFISLKEAEFVIDEELSQLNISGNLYGKTIDINDGVVISMVEPIEITRKVNGSAIGNIKTGYFLLESDTRVYLNLGDSTHDWIEIKDEDEYYYINLKDEQETIDLYQDLLDLLE